MHRKHPLSPKVRVRRRRTQRPCSSRNLILFLAANPSGSNQLALDEEARATREELERSGHRTKFELVTRWAVRPLDLLRELRKIKPAVVHFSGHGRSGARGESVAGGLSSRDI